MSVLCRIGLHRWAKLSTTVWLNQPSLFRNERGLAMEYRLCEREGCNAITDTTAFASDADADHGFPTALGPLASRRFLEVVNGPRIPLLAPPIPLSDAAVPRGRMPAPKSSSGGAA